MADNENYIGVAMGLDVTDLKSGLKETSMRIKEANAEFKTAASGMDDWQQSVDGVRAKVRQLDTVLQAQRSSLGGLQAEYQRVVEAQGEGSDAARRLQLRIQGQQAAINSTERELNNYRETLQQAEQGNIDLTQTVLQNGRALDNQADSSEKASKGMSAIKGATGIAVGGLLALGGAIVGVIGGFLSLAESTRETRNQMAQLEVAFTDAGHSVEAATKTYTELYGVLGDSGKSTEAAQQLAKLTDNEQQLSEMTHILTGVYATFGDALPVEGLAEAMNHTAKLGSVQGNLADALEWSGVNVDDFNAQLSTLNTEEERQALITSTLNGLYSEQADAFKERNADIIAAQESEAALSLAMAELGKIAEPIMTTLKLLAVDLIKAITPFVELIGDGLTGAFEGAAGSSQKLAEGIGGIINVLLDKLMNMIPTVLNIILQLIPSIATTLLNALPQLLDTIIELVMSIINLLTTLLPDIVAKIVEIIPILIEKLVAAVPYLLQAAITFLMAIVQAIPTIVTSLLDELPKLIATILDTLIASIPILLDGAIQLFNAIVEAIPTIIISLTENLPKIINTIIDAVVKAVPMLIDAAITLYMALIDALPTIIDALLKALPKVINTILDAVLNALPQLLDAAIQLFMALVNAIPKIIPKLVSALPKIITTIVTILIQNLPAIIDAAIQLFMGIVSAIPKIIPELIGALPQIISSIVEGLLNGLPDIKEVGKRMVEGIWDGIKNAKNWLRDKIKNFAGDVAGWFKKTFKIGSPSRLMADEVGLYVGEGVGEGILDSMPYVKKNLNSFSTFVGKNLGNIKSGMVLNGPNNTLSGISSGGSSSTVVNAPMTVNYNGTLSRKELRKLEQQNDKRIITKLKLQGV